MASLTDSEVIDQLGGTSAVAVLCGVVASAVSMWRTEGIPAGRRIQLAKELERAGKPAPGADFFDRGIPSPRAKASGAGA